MDEQQHAATREVQQYVARTPVGKVMAQFGATSQDERDTLEYAFSAYGFLVERNERLSLEDFADRISRNFDVTVPRNAEVVRVLRHCATHKVVEQIPTDDASLKQCAGSSGIFARQTVTHRVSAYTGENHSVRVQRMIEASTPHKAAETFAAQFGQTIYPGRREQPCTEDDQLFSVMSFGWTGHGQRIYVYTA